LLKIKVWSMSITSSEQGKGLLSVIIYDIKKKGTLTFKPVLFRLRGPIPVLVSGYQDIIMQCFNMPGAFDIQK